MPPQQAGCSPPAHGRITAVVHSYAAVHTASGKEGGDSSLECDGHGAGLLDGGAIIQMFVACGREGLVGVML